MASNSSETVVQLDGQEQPQVEMERRVIVEAVRKFSSLAKGSASRTDFRKSFFPVTKSPRPMLHPWPSTTSISRPVPSTTVLEGAPWKNSFKSRQSSIEDSDGLPSVSSQDERNQEGVVNSAFTGERSDICDCDQIEEDLEETDLPQCRCGQRISCHHSPVPEMIHMSVIDSEPNRPRVDNHSRHSARRNWLTPDCRHQREKGLQWRFRIPGKPFRRRTTDSVPTMDVILSQTRSSPNLRNLEEQAKAARRSLKIDRSCKQEDDSQL